MKAMILTMGMGTKIQSLTDEHPGKLARVNGNPARKKYYLSPVIWNKRSTGECASPSRIRSGMLLLPTTDGEAIFPSATKRRITETGGGLKKPQF
jgi:hypothetical protein